MLTGFNQRNGLGQNQWFDRFKLSSYKMVDDCPRVLIHLKYAYYQQKIKSISRKEIFMDYMEKTKSWILGVFTSRETTHIFQSSTTWKMAFCRPNIVVYRSNKMLAKWNIGGILINFNALVSTIIPVDAQQALTQ